MARVEPNNIEAEINTLGCAFLSKTSVDKVVEELSGEMFYSKKNKTIFQILKYLHKNDIAVDITTVSNELEKNKQLGNIGGIEYLTEVINSVATTANLDYYINIIYTKYILRELIAKSTEIINDCYDEKKDLTEIVETAEKQILSINSNRMTKEIRGIQDIITRAQEEIE